MNEIEAEAHGHLAEIFVLTGQPELAREHASRSLSIAERKNDIALATRLREWLTAAGVDVS